MPTLSRPGRILLVLALLLCPTTALAIWAPDPYTGIAVCSAGNNQTAPQAVPDGAGGVIVTWEDRRAGSQFDIYAQRLNAAGIPQWAPNGVAVCTASSDQRAPTLASDGAGGAIITWYDYRSSGFPDIYAQRINAAGVAQWAGNGVAICTASFEQYNPRIASFGTNEAVITWFDYRGGATADIYAQRIDGSGAGLWGANGLSVCNAANDQWDPVIASDGTYAFIAWRDVRSVLDQGIYVQQFNAAGTGLCGGNGISTTLGGINPIAPPAMAVDGVGGAVVAWVYGNPGDSYVYSQRIFGGAKKWGSAGIEVDPSAPVPGPMTNPVVVPDGTGGTMIAWRDTRFLGETDIYAQRLNVPGARQWTGVGALVSKFAGLQPIAVSDGEGGAFFTWADTRFGASDIYLQRIDGTGTRRWGDLGRPLNAFPNDQANPALVWASPPQAIVVWEDSRGGGVDIYADRVDRYDRIGDAGGRITGITDLPNDQGGNVRVRWRRSYLDTIPTLEVATYGVWRQVTGAAAASALAAQSTAEPTEARPGVYRAISTAAGTTYWEGVGTAAARGDSVYTFVAPTFQDSTGAGNPRTTFMVDAHGAFKPGLWDSQPDSGYSVDNIPPVAPAPFTGAYASGVTHLHWNPNLEPDLQAYRLHRGTSASFVPAPGNLIATLSDTGYADPGGAPYFYKLAAMDLHGNLSAFALYAPPSSSVDGEGLPREVALGPPSPNPALTSTSLTFAQPREGYVRLALFDLAGRRVRSLIDAVRPAGWDAAAWDLRDDRGDPVHGGIYLARLEAGGQMRVRRIILLR